MINHINIRILQKPKVNPMIYDFFDTEIHQPSISIYHNPI